METKQLIYEMLTEKTGKALCDSGGENGRHWQKNQLKSLEDFENEPTVTHEIWDNEINYTISLFHYLTRQLELDDVCNEFNEMAVNDWDSDIHGVSEQGKIWLDDKGFKINSTVNSYNHESSLSQVIQYTHLMLDDDYYVLIQIHQGCDVRGGYTDAVLFKLDNDYCYDDGYLSPEDVLGIIDGIGVCNNYNGYSLTDEYGNNVPVNEKSSVCLELSIS